MFLCFLIKMQSFWYHNLFYWYKFFTLVHLFDYDKKGEKLKGSILIERRCLYKANILVSCFTCLYLSLKVVLILMLYENPFVLMFIFICSDYCWIVEILILSCSNENK